MALKGKQWPVVATNDIPGLSRWAQQIQTLLQKGYHRDFHLGAVILSAGTTTTLADVNLTPTSNIFFTATNAQARALGIPSIGAKAMRSFTLTHNNAAGTETYDYVILAIPAA